MKAKSLFLFGGASFVALTCWLGVENDTYAQFPEGARHEHIMERKLASTQEILEGIARADFEQIGQQSQRLHLLSREAGWNVLATPTYLRLSEDFRATAIQLEKAAEDKNLDAVGLAYVKLSISCIECHRHTRDKMPRVGVVPRKNKLRDRSVSVEKKATATPVKATAK